MRTSRYPLNTTKETPADAEIVSHRLMLRAGMIRKLAAGIYTWMPLGLKVLRRVERVVREELDSAGAMELLLPAVQPAELWQETGRWEKYGPLLLRIRDRHEREFCFGPTHEEVITDIARRELKSYRQLPVIYYQIQTKFRDEIRPRFGVMRAREFLMKDAYSFHTSGESLDETYWLMHETYTRIFERLGLRFRAVRAESGEIGGSFSHEFHVLAESGEDVIAYSDSGEYAANVELAELGKVSEGDPSPDGKGKLKLARGIEVGHIFQLGTKYSASMNATVSDEDGNVLPMAMGCYGIGISRIVAAAIEQNHDEDGIIWPEPLAPFQVALLPVNARKSQRVRDSAEKLYAELREAGVDVLLDDREIRPGVMFAEAELIGIPHRVVIGDKGLERDVVEYKGRRDDKAEDVPLADITAFLQEKLSRRRGDAE